MKKVFGCFSPKGSPKKRNQNPNTTADAGNRPCVKWAYHRDLITDGTTSDPGPTTSPTPAPTPVPGSASAPASASASTSTNRGKSEKADNSATASPYTLARIMELTEEMETLSLNLGVVPIQKFTFIQLQLATENFSPDNCVGRGGFGRVYKGNLAPENQQVAIKRLDPKSEQGTREFVTELELLSNADHENIVRLIGYCAENEHRMLVYEYIRMGSLEDHLLNHYDTHLGVLDWDTRVRIAYEIAKGLQYLHEMEPHKMIYRDLKSANVLLGEGFTVKLSDFGCAKRAPPPDEKELNYTRILGTTGYLDPKYFVTGNCTFESDIYTFGVVLLELVTGRKGLDVSRPPEERSLVIWATRVLSDSARFSEIVDPLLEGKFDEFSLHGLVSMARYCVQSEPNRRPKMHHIVDVLRQINKVPDEPKSPRFRKLIRSHTFPSASTARVSRVMT